jgi:hypothetical protein
MDTFVNQKAKWHNEGIKTEVSRIIFDRIEAINKHGQTGEPACIRSRTEILNRFLAEVKKY